MITFVNKLWHRLFLVERSAIGLSFVRIIIALTTIFYVAPTLCHLEDNYFNTAFKTLDASFLPMPLIELVQKSPEWVIILFVWIFAVSSLFFLVGFLSQLSCIVMVGSCYYFHALNSFHLGSTLSWDILLVALFLFCISGYHGDYFSVDAYLWGREGAYKKLRPFFVVRLLQLHVGFMYFYTALYKITAQGNWIKDNPLYYVMNYPPAGVTKYFLLRDFMMDKPALCYWLGLFIVTMELLMLPLLIWRKTRITAIYLGFVFQLTLLLTLDVPAILFFLFTSLLLLWINPDDIVAWIEQKRSFNAKAGRIPLIYDGDCGFCNKSVRALKVMDMFGTLNYLNFRDTDNISQIHPDLNPEKATREVCLAEPSGKLYGGFEAFRRLSFSLPMMYPMIPIFYLPGMGVVGPLCYKLIAKNRFFLDKFLPR